MVTFKKGDLLEATEDIIAHQVNCYGVAGGLAAAVFEKWPKALNSYTEACETVPKNLLLGRTQLINIPEVRPPVFMGGYFICNLFGQLKPGADYNPAALNNALHELGVLAKHYGWTVALPYKLSCGIAGGNWETVLKIIEKTMEGVDCVIYQREGD